MGTTIAASREAIHRRNVRTSLGQVLLVPKLRSQLRGVRGLPGFSEFAQFDTVRVNPLFADGVELQAPCLVRRGLEGKFRFCEKSPVSRGFSISNATAIAPRQQRQQR
jgi:hypothetical protein